MRKKLWFSLSSLVVISVMIVALVSGLAQAAETDTTETPSSEAQVLEAGANECPALNGECPYSGEQFRENNRYGLSPDAKGEGVGQQIRQQVQARDESCLTNPEAAQARCEARDARQNNRYGLSQDAKGEGTGQQIRQQIQARDESCLADPEAVQARQEARDARQSDQGSRGRMARQARSNTPDA